MTSSLLILTLGSCTLRCMVLGKNVVWDAALLVDVGKFVGHGQNEKIVFIAILLNSDDTRHSLP